MAARLADERARSPVDGPSDFAGKDARNSFFEVFKRESRRRQAEGTGSQCEECQAKSATLGMKLVESGSEHGLWKRHEPRWCHDCAKKSHPEVARPDDDVFDALTVDVDSPRRRFLSDCENQGLPPLPLLIWEDDEDKTLVRLNNFRLGDKLINAYSHGLRLLSNAGLQIEQLHMQSCAMSDSGVASVTEALKHLPRLTVLDLSKNHIGKLGGNALQEGLRSHKAIRTVILASCQLSDAVAGGVMASLRDHPSLTSLDMSRNALGSTPAGFQPLKDILEDQGQLTILKFSWNSLNSSAMRVIAEPLKTNSTLTDLDISWNSIQDDGAMALTASLRFNDTLQSLNLTHNDIREKGGMVIGDCLKENRGLKTLVFNGNPLGTRGGRGILRGLRWMCEFGIKRTMLFESCNFAYKDTSSQLFDPAEAAGTWECSLDDPYQRTVANELVELAWTQPGENWKDEKLDGKPYELVEPALGQVLTRDDFKLPEEGVLSVTYVPTERISRRSDVLSAATFFELVRLINTAKNEPDRVALIKLASDEFFFTAENTATLMTMFPGGGMLRVEVASLMLPRTVDVVNWNREVFNRLNDGELARLAKKMGQLFTFSPRNPTNHYRLELSKHNDRVLFHRLVEIAREERDFRRVRMQKLEHLGVSIGGAIDSSQKGDFDNWRNEKIKDGMINVKGNTDPQPMHPGSSGTWQPLDIDSKNPPVEGTIECDYVSTNTVHRLAKVDTIPSQLLNLLKMDLVNAIRHVRISKSALARSPRSRGSRGLTPSKNMIDLNDVGSALGVTIAGKTSRGWWKGEDGESDGTRSPMSRPTSRASSRGSPPSSRPGSQGDISINARPDSRDSVGATDESLVGRGGSGDVSTRSNISAVSASSQGSGSGSKVGKKKKKKKRKVPKRGAALTEAEQAAFETAAAIQLQRIFRGYRARWGIVHPKLHECGMIAADRLQRDQGWAYYLREWQAMDVEVEIFGVMKKLTIADMEWAASTFQKVWRGRCVRQVVRRSRVKQMEATLESAAVSKRWANAAERPCWMTGPHSMHVAYSESERDVMISNRCAAILRRSTMCYYFTASQVAAILAAVPPAARLESLIALWGMVTDLENLHVDEILEGTDPNEVLDEKAVEKRKAEFYDRIGICNAFNPYMPDGHYVLNLRHPVKRIHYLQITLITRVFCFL